MRTAPRVWLLLAVLAASCGPAYRLNVDPNYRIDATDFPLPSGLRVIFQRDPGQPSVLVTSVIDSGSSEDPPGKEGLAHLVEHLCFRATRPGASITVREEIERLGAGTFNASTRDDFTDYYTLGPKAALVPLLQIEANRLLDPLAGVTNEILAIEREVVRNELRMRTENTLAYKLYELSKTALFPEGHPYHRSGIGSHESLDAITLEDVRAWVKEHYVPAHTTIVVSGDFPEKDLGTILNRAFPRELVAAPGTTDVRITLGTPTARVLEAAPEPPPPADTSLRRVEGPVAREALVLAWSLPGGYRENEPVIELTVGVMTVALRKHLGPHFGFRKRERIESIGCSPILNRDASIALCVIQLAKGEDPADIAKRAMAGLEDLHKGLLGETQLYELVKQERLADLFRESSSIWRATRIAEYAHHRGRADFFTGTMNRWSKIDPKVSHALARQYLRAERTVKAVVEPYRLDGARTVGFNPASTWAGDAFEGARDTSWITNEAVAAVATAPDPSTIRASVLPNGLKVLVKDHGSAPFVRVGLFLHGGRATAKPWGMPDFAALLASSRNPRSVGGTWIGGSLGDAEFLGVETPSGNLDEALDILRDRVTGGLHAFSPDIVDRFLREQRKRIEKRPKVPARAAQRVFWKTLYPQHPFGQRAYDEDALREVTRPKAVAWLKDHYSPENATLIVVGSVRPDEAHAKAAAVWSGWRKRNPGREDPGFEPPSAGPATAKLLLLDDPAATQTDFMVGCRLAPLRADDDAARDVLVGMLRTDLYSSIRERAGASYGVGVRAHHASGGIHMLHVSTLIQNDKAAPALETILKRLRSIAGGSLGNEDIAGAKWQAAVETHTANISPREMFETFVALSRDRRPVEHLTTYPARLAAVRSTDVGAMLGPCGGREVVTAVGPLRVIEGPLRALGLETKIVDWQDEPDSDLADEDDLVE